MIDDLVKALLARQPRFWGVAITFIVVCASLGPSLMGLWDKWKDRRSGRRETEREKEQLEVIKLRCEIELLQQQLRVASPPSAGPAQPPPAAVPESPRERPAAALKAAARAEPWRWVSALNARHPAAVRLILTALLAVGWALFAFFICMVLFSIKFIVAPDKDLSSSDATVTLILCSLVGAPVGFAIVRLRAQRRALSGHGGPPAGRA